MAEDITVLAGSGRSGRRVAGALRVTGHHVRVARRGRLLGRPARSVPEWALEQAALGTRT